MSLIKHYQILEDELKSKPFEEGALYVTSDTNRIFADFAGGGSHTLISASPIILSTEIERENLLAPIHNTVYFVSNTSKLYVYNSGNWLEVSYTHPSYTSHQSDLYKISVDGTGHVNGATAVKKEDITALGIPGKDTTYEVASTSSNGLMSTSMVSDLNTAKTHAGSSHAPSNAQPNQNAFSNVKVGSTTIAADTTTDTLELVGSNVTITPDATNDKVTIGITKTNVTTALGYTPPTTNTTYGVVSTSADGLAPKRDGSTTKFLRGDGTWAVPPDNNTVYTHPTTSGNKHIPSGGSSGQILRWSADGTAVWGNDNNTTYSNATTSTAGLMSASDKSKLDGIATGANKITVDSAMSSTSTNPVQNKAVYTAINNIKGVPSCTTSNNGQFLRVVNGVATWSTISSAEGASF